jgi:hypothetical protein
VTYSVLTVETLCLNLFRISKSISFRFYWEVALFPFVPATLEGVDFRVSLVHEFLCHPGTRSLAGSGAVKDQRLVPGILVHPGLYFLWIFTDGSFDLGTAVCGVTAETDVDDDHLGTGHQGKELLL